MPQVSWGDIHANGHIGGNADVFPFYPQSGTKVEQMKRAMLAALDSGINGFQFLTVVPQEAWEAAEEVRKETGKLFYIAPEWCDMGPDRKKAAERIADFLKKYGNSPFVYRRNGVQVHFLYNHGKWAGENTSRSEGVADVKKMLADQGLKVSGLLVCGVLISALGAVMDVALGIASSVWEMKEQNPDASVGSLFRSGMQIGKDAMGTMANTLILAFAGSSLNMLILVQTYNIPFLQLINTDSIALEVVQSVAGSIGILLTVPLVALISARLMARRKKAGV